MSRVAPTGPGSDANGDGARTRADPMGDLPAVAWICAILTLEVLAALWHNADFFLRDDFLNYYLGAYAEIVRALKAGELPLLTLTSWHAGALAGEYQYGLFSPALVLCNLLLFSLDLSLGSVAASLVWIHALILSGGAYLLARSRRLAPELALMVALAATLNGWLAVWGVNWFAALAAFAWLPWAWWAIERALARPGERRHAVVAGIFVMLVVTAGFPYACLMVVLAAAAAAGRLAIDRRPLRDILPAVWSVAIGLGLSAPAWLMLVEYSGTTMRSQATHSWLLQTDLLVPTEAWLATVLPTLKASWQAPWITSGQTSSLVMHMGLAPVVLLTTAGLILRSELYRKLRYDVLFLAILFSLVSLPGIAVLRWSFRWLPLFFLQAALLAAGAAMLLRAADRSRPGYGRVAWILVAAVSAYVLLVEGHRSSGNLRLAAGLLVLASLWWGLESSRKTEKILRHMPWIVVAVSSFMTFEASLRGSPYQLRRVEPRAAPAFDPSVTYLALYTMDDTRGELITFSGQRHFPGNEHMHSGLRLVNGYTPLQPAGTAWTFGLNYLGAMQEDWTRRLPLASILRRMAVDGLIVWPGSRSMEQIPFEDFEKVASMPEADVYHRRGARSPRVQIVRRAMLVSPSKKIWRRVRSPLPVLEASGQHVGEPTEVELGDAELALIGEGRHRVELDVGARDSPVVVSFARQWFPGYRAYVDGKPVDVWRLDAMMPAVRLPAGERCRVLLVYRPWSWILGLTLCGLALALSLAALALDVRRRGSAG